MRLSVDYIYKFCLDLIRKNQSGGLGNEQFERFWNDAQSSYMDDMLGRFQNRSNGKTGTNTGLIEDETIMQKLSPFIQPPTALTITNGVSDKPTDFVYRLALRINGFDCYKINQGQIATVKANVIDPPSVTDNKYYFIEYKAQYSYFPNTVTESELDYIATPPNIKWGFDYDSDGRQVYNEGTSAQSLWDTNSNREITKRMLSDLGVSFKDKDFSNFGKSVEMTGE